MNEYDKIKSKLSDRWWRLNHLYYIRDKSGKKVLFKPNWAQRKLHDNLWFFNIILKARQLGFTTFTMIYFLDACLFNSNHMAGVVAHTRLDAEDLFKNKVKFAYDNLPEWLKTAVSASTDSARELALSNGSSIVVGTSLRSGTFQKLLISEYGKVSARYPEKAKEIKTGALNTVDQGQQIFVESTAEGQAGEFYELCQTARRLADTGKELVSMEPRFHFFPWYENETYTLEDDHLITVTAKQDEYFRELGVELTKGQKAWYAVKQDTMGFEMLREYPSTPSEAFEGSTEGAYYTDEMATIRRKGRITRIPYDPAIGVYTFWDIGVRDLQAIWFAQYKNGELYFIDYHESSGNGWNFYAEMLKDKGYTYLSHMWPHDGNKRIQADEVFTSRQIAEGLGISPIVIIPRTKDASYDIRNYCKPTLYLSYFDGSKCAAGINHLDNYRRQWDTATSMFKQEPYHGIESNGADAIRTGFMAFRTGKLSTKRIMSGRTTQKLKTIQRFKGKNKVLKSKRY